MTIDWLTLLIYGLACFRLSVMLGEDSGPYRLFTKLRSKLKREAKQHPAVRKSAVHEGIECLRCNSVWFGLPLTLYWFGRALDVLDDRVVLAGDAFLLWMALSALAILFNRMFPKR